MRGPGPREADPSSVFAFREATLSHKGRGKKSSYGVRVIGDRSTNQLFGCTKFLIFGLMARGATS
jgi:hypothetical protein